MFKARKTAVLSAVLALFSLVSPPVLQISGDSPVLVSLGVSLKEAAARNGLSPDHLSSILSGDPAASLDSFGNVLYTMRPSDAGVEDPSLPSNVLNAGSPAPLSWDFGGINYTSQDALALHSSPSSPLRIYLDFTGHTTVDPYWAPYGGSTIVSAPLDYDSNPSSFSVQERNAIGKVWSAVAEDFAPWDVDVTTEEPPLSDLIKSDAADTRYGVRIVMTPSSFMNAGGVAFMNSFSWPSDTPAFCFCTNYSTNDMALVVSHEAGHTVGLAHDGRYSSEYYSGHESWGPLMGAPYGKTVSQWSKGDYSSSTNKQDDFSVVNSFLPYVKDDLPNTYASASYPSGLKFQGRISSPSDKDWFKVYSTGQSFSLSLNPAQFANLDPLVELWRNNVLVKRVDPASISLTHTFDSLSPGEYRLMIDGTGYTWPSGEGYSDYGSVGDYLVTLSGAVSVDQAPKVTLTPSVLHAVESSSVSFVVSSTENPSLEGLSFSWSISSGAQASGSSATVSMPSVGPLKATVVVTSAGGTPAVASAEVRLSKPPSVVASVSRASIHAGTQVSFSAAGRDPDRQVLSYSWVFSDGSSSNSPTVFKNPGSVGSFSGTVTVSDADGNTVSASKAVTVVENLAPSVSLSSSRTSGAAPASFTFTALGSDPERSTLKYLWSFPDGSSASSARVSKVISSPGSHTVTVTATDSGGFSSSASVVVTVTGNSAPVISSASVSAAASVAPSRLSFRASGSDPDKHALSYVWAFSDGTSATGQSVAKLFSNPGNYTATVSVSDAGGLTASEVVSFSVAENSAPSVSVSYSGSLTKAAPASFLLVASGSDPDKQTLSYSWVFSDGSSSKLASVSKSFPKPGTYTATVTVSDPGGLKASEVVTLTVSPNSTPVISSASVSLSSAPSGTPRVFSVSASDPDSQRLSYRWVFSNGGTSSSASVTKSFSTPGSFSATITVTDVGGLSVSQVVYFTVT